MASLGGCAIALGSLQELRAKYVRDFGDAAVPGRTFQFVRHQAHPCGRAVTLVDWAGIRSSTLPVQHEIPAPKYGANTLSVLAELGYQPTEIDGLLEAGIVSESWSKDYMPA
jgi:hypothetical protein